MSEPGRPSGKRGFRAYDWDAIAGILAAGAALILHLLHVIETDVLLTIALVVLALLLFRDLRREADDEELMHRARDTQQKVEELVARSQPPDTVLIGPRQLRPASEAFARGARGEMIWFNVCLLMFRPQVLFDSLLAPALVNPAVTGVQFVLDESEREAWEREVVPKAAATMGALEARGRLVHPRRHRCRDDGGSPELLGRTVHGAPAGLRHPPLRLPREEPLRPDPPTGGVGAPPPGAAKG
jgi:hypothetical protein